MRELFFDKGQDRFEAIGDVDGNTLNRFVLIGLVVNDEWKQVHIHKICLPAPLRHQGIGKRLIKAIFSRSVQMGHELFLSNMTDSFYNRMLKRGALACEKGDMVQIVPSTRFE